MTPNRHPYIIDTSAVIALYRERYPRKVFSSLWANIDGLVQSRKLLTVNQVVSELELSRDGDGLESVVARDNLEMFNWVAHVVSKIVEIDGKLADDVEAFGMELTTIHRDWIEKHEVADPFVIAAAKLFGGTVISDERGRHSRQVLERHKEADGVYPRETKIPSICEIYDVPHVDLVEFFEAEGWRY